VGSIPHESKVILITDNWIRPALRALALPRKRQCGVPFSYEERQKKVKMRDAEKGAGACAVLCPVVKDLHPIMLV
jgi:hypothetical protein